MTGFDRAAPPAPPRRRLAGRLARNVTVIFATVVATLTLMFVRTAEERIDRGRAFRTALVAAALAREIGRAMRDVDVPDVHHALESARALDAELLCLAYYDARGVPLAVVGPEPPGEDGRRLAAASLASRRPERREKAGRHAAAWPIPGADGGEGALLVVHDLESAGRDRRAVYGAGALALALALAAGAAASALIARRIAAPIAAIHRGAVAVAAGDLAVRLPEEGDDETALIARAFNAATGALVEKIRALEASAAELAAANRELDGRIQDLRSLKEAGKIFASVFNLDELLRAIVENACLVMKSNRCSVVVRDEATGEYSLRVGKGIAGEAGIVENVRLRSGGRITERVIETREPLLVTDLRADGRFDLPYGGERYATDSFVAAPILFGARTLGVLSVTDRRDGARYVPADLHLLCVYANHVAIALENARVYRRLVDRERLDRELSVARDIQMSLLPEGYPALDGIAFAGHSEPAREVGGDYFDFLPVTRDRVGVVIGDVSGKGVPAALLMVMIRSVLRARVDGAASPSSLVRELNAHLLTEGDDKMFVTLFYAEVDAARRTLRYCNAGHNETLLLRADGSVETLEAGGPLMGMFESAAYVEGRAALADGDLLVLYTDGITETPGEGGALYETDRLAAVARRHAHLPAEAIRDAILADVRRYAGDGPPHDDRTLIVIKVGPRADGKASA